MVVNKDKKSRKFRGKRSQGYGSHKKHRGGGSRGGRGKAGAHKHKWSHTVKFEKDRFGKRGFKNPVKENIKSININVLGKLAAGKRKINLSELGYKKVLGSGKLNVALEVTADMFSKKAIEKIENAGGKVVMLKSNQKTPIPAEEILEQEG